MVVVGCTQSQSSTEISLTSSSAVEDSQRSEPPSDRAVEVKKPEVAGVPSPAIAAKLSAEQIEQLQGLGIKIAIPTQVPAEFVVSNVKTQEIKRQGQGGDPSYMIVYRKPGGTCFVIESARDGLGGPVPENSMPIKVRVGSALEGYDYRLYWQEQETGKPPFPKPIAFSDWIADSDAFYRLSSGSIVAQDCQSISPELAVTLIESLEYLNP